MDQKLPKDKLPVKPAMQIVKLTPLPFSPSEKPVYRGTIPFRETLTVEDIAERLTSSRPSQKKASLIADFRGMLSEVYRAVAEGFNVDLDLFRSELVVQGTFQSPHDDFDRKKHSLGIRLYPSPLLKQIVGEVPAEVHANLFGNGPLVTQISHLPNPYSEDGELRYPYNTLPTNCTRPLYIFGRYLKVEGDHPETGLLFQRLSDGKSLFVPPKQLVINTASTLCFLPKEALEAGQWQLSVTTQLNSSYHLVKTPRRGTLLFTCSDDTPAG